MRLWQIKKSNDISTLQPRTDALAIRACRDRQKRLRQPFTRSLGFESCEPREMMAADLNLHAIQMASGSDRGIKLEIAYDLTGTSGSKNAQIRLYTSTTNQTLETFNVSLSSGTGKTLEIQPHYIDSFQDDYSLMASVTLTSLAEPDTSNNAAQFAGGAFLCKATGPWGAQLRFVEMFGTASADTYTLSVLETSGTDTVRVTDGVGTYDYSASPLPNFIIRTQGGNDTVQTADYIGAPFEYFINAFGGEGNDTFDMSVQTVSKVLYGGAGDDTFILAGGAGGFYGEAGSDTYRFLSSTNSTGYTYFMYEKASDTGTDTLDFSALSVGITLNLANISTDQTVTAGANGLKLRLSEIAFENVIGGSASDTITGNSLNNDIQGGGSNDTISGGDGNDTLHGGDGVDTIHGNVGDDTIFGDAGADFLYGDEGTDTFDSDPNDTVYQD